MSIHRLTLPLLVATSALAQVSVLTYHNDNARTGQNLNEVVLSPANVRPGSFGKRFAQPIDGFIWGQPLYVPALRVAGRGVHNVVYVATSHDSVYAFDADNDAGPNALPLWQVSFLDSAAGVTTVSASDVGCPVAPELGISGTPVIDPQFKTLYVVASTKEPGPKFVHRLHALDITSGKERPGSPREIQAAVTGSGDGGTTVTFVPLTHKLREGLLLSNGVIYTAWSGHCDNGAYHGWLLGYDAKTLEQVSVFNASPNGQGASFWGGSTAPAADDRGNIYLISANGTFDADSGGRDLGESFLKLAPVPAFKTLAIADYFTPYNRNYLNDFDLDLGSSGALLLPDEAGSTAHPHVLVGAGKEGRIYVIDRDRMGRAQSGTDGAAIQTLPNALETFFGAPAYFDRTVYFAPAAGPMRAFPIADARLTPSPSSKTLTAFRSPGAVPSVSATGTRNGIVWVTQVAGDGALQAYDARDLSQQLYNSLDNQAVDYLGELVPYSAATIADGKVYAGSQDSLVVYGLLPSPAATVGAAVNSATFANGVAVAPGSLISVFGSNLARTTASAGAFPLPIALGDATLTINGVPAPLIYVSPTQINAQVPFETAPGAASAVVSVSGVQAQVLSFPVAASGPGLFTYGQNRAAAQNQDGKLNDAAHPAAAGTLLTAYVTGQGMLDGSIETGDPAAATPILRPVLEVTATVGGIRAEVAFAGLVPGLAGLAQVNLTIPTLSPGNYPLVITIGDVPSNGPLITISGQ